jgi:anti-sigma B factor antagonist
MLSQANPWLSTEAVEGATVVAFTSGAVLDETAVRVIGEELTRLVERLGAGRLVLDFGKLKQFSSRLLGVLVSVHNRIKAAGGKLVLCGLDQHALDVLRVTHLDQILPTYQDRGSALQSL